MNFDKSKKKDQLRKKLVPGAVGRAETWSSVHTDTLTMIADSRPAVNTQCTSTSYHPPKELNEKQLSALCRVYALLIDLAEEAEADAGFEFDDPAPPAMNGDAPQKSEPEEVD